MGNCVSQKTKPFGKQNQLNQTWPQILDGIFQQIQSSENSCQIMSHEIWKYALNQFRNFHLTKDQKLELVQILKKYFQINNGLQKIEDEAAFCGELGSKLHKLENTLHFKHKESIEYLKFAASKSHLSSNQQSDQLLFSQLKFTLSQQQALEVAAKVRIFCSNDISAFAFLSLYLKISIMNKIQTEPLKCVQQNYLNLLKTLEKRYPASISEYEVIDLTASFEKVAHKYEVEELHFQAGEESHYEQLKKHIINKAQDAKNDLKLFEKLVKNICYEKGYGFKSGVKIKNRQHTIAILRTIEKIVEDRLSDAGIINQSFDKVLSPNQMKNLIQQQKIRAHLKVESIPNSEKSIKVEMKDLLRGKCTFSTIEDLIQTVNNLIRHIRNQGYEIIEFKNRLIKHTKDAVLILKLPNSIAQLQLVLQLDSVSNEFNHKIYELIRSKLYSPITNLYVQNQKWSETFFSQQFDLFEEFLQNKSQIDSQIVLEDFKKDLLDFQVNFLHPYGILSEKNNAFKIQDKILVQKEIEELKKIIRHKHPSSGQKNKQQKREQNLIYNQVRFLKQCYQYDKALLILEKIDQSLLVNNRNLINEKGEILKKKNKLEQSLECFLTCQKIQNEQNNKSNHELLVSADTLQNIGMVYYDQGIYPKALQNFEQCLKIRTQIQGKDNLPYANILMKIGLVYRSSGNYPKALQNYQQCLQIRTRLLGKDSTDRATTLQHTGMAYFSQGNYLKALQNYEKCLEIRTKITGKDSMDVAVILNKIGNVYKDQSKLQKAIEYFEKSLEIRVKIKGRESLDVAVALNSIGNVHRQLKNYKLALQNYQESLELRIKVKGKDLIDVAVALNGIGSTYQEMGDSAKAMQYFERCMEIRTKVKGKDSIDVALTLDSIGTAYNSLGQYEKALESYQEGLEINTKVKGKESINVAETLYLMSFTYEKMGKVQEALSAVSESYEIRKKVLGEGNKKTKLCLSRIEELSKLLVDQSNEFYFLNEPLKITTVY